MDDLLGLRHLQEQKYKKRLALGEDIQHLAKQKHNLTRIHTLGYIEEPQFIERSAAIEQQIRERKQQLSRNDMSNTSEKILQKTRLIQKKLSSTPPLELFDESVFKELVKKVLISNTAIQFELINGIEPFTHTQTPALASRKRLLMRVLLFGKVSYYTMDTGSRIKLVREHRGLTQQKLGEMLGYGKSSANRIAQYEMGYRSPKANRLKEIAKAMNIREEIFLMPDETPIDLLRILIWYDWEHEGVLQLATSRTANTPPGKTVSPIIYSEQLPLNRLLLDWADQKHSLSVRKITRADYLEWMLQWPPRLP